MLCKICGIRLLSFYIVVKEDSLRYINVSCIRLLLFYIVVKVKAKGKEKFVKY